MISPMLSEMPDGIFTLSAAVTSSFFTPVYSTSPSANLAVVEHADIASNINMANNSFFILYSLWACVATFSKI